MDEAAGGGSDIITMHVQTNASSQLQHYAQNIADVDFVLLGYWNCGTYVEGFDLFNPSAANAWTDVNLSSYGVGAGEMTEVVVINVSGSVTYPAGLRTNGSTLERRVNLMSTPDGVDGITMIVRADNTVNAAIEAYAGHTGRVDFYLMGYWSGAPGTYVEKFADIGNPSVDATWEDKDLTSSGVGDGDVAEILLVNAMTTEEDQIGVRTNGSSLARLFNIRQTLDGDGDFGRMHVQTDSAAVIEFQHQDISDTHHFFLLGYWDVGVLLSDHTEGQESDGFHELGGQNNAELFAFQFTPCAGGMTVTQMVFRLTNIVGLTNGDWAGVQLVVDNNLNGNVGAGETTTVGGAGVVNQAAGTITFSTSFNVDSATEYILRADFASLSSADEVTISLVGADVAATQGVTGSTSAVTHIEKAECYVEKFETWQVDTNATWETMDLSDSPYSIPANAVVEIAMLSSATAETRSCGVRAVGSNLDRRLTLRKAEAGGVVGLVMHVQTDSNSQIEQYAQAAGTVDMTLLGYWTCGTYVELFDTFTAGASGSWQDQNLCAYGIRPGHVAEIVMTNNDGTSESEAGVRTNGSSLQRRLNLNKAEAGGVETATMFVEADTTTKSTIEAYAQANGTVSFYLVGYWSVTPLAYSELFTDVGTPSSNASWQDLDLTSSGVPNSAHAEFVLANEDIDNERKLGVRNNGSALSRFENLHESEDGGASFIRMHVPSDATASIEFYHSNVASSNSYFLVGFWTDCSLTTSYLVTDLDAVTATKYSLAHGINNVGDVAASEEDANGNPVAWISACGSVSSLGTLGGSYAEALEISDSGEVVGWAHAAGGARRAFSWTSGGGMVNLGTVGGRNASEALSVNANGEIVGTGSDYIPNPEDRLAFIYLPSPAYSLSAGMNSLGTLGGSQSVGLDVNDAGQVVGGAENASGNFRPFRWEDGTMTDLGTLGGESVRPDHRGEAVNTHGDVAGRSYTSGGAKHAFVYDNAMFDLGVLTGGTESWAFAINDDQVVVGASNITGGAFHAFVWDVANGMRDLNNLIPGGSGWTLVRATDINNHGSIVGWGTNPSSQTRAFLLTPTCSAGGGGSTAASVIASGSGVTDDVGGFEELAVDTELRPVAEISVYASEPGIRVDYELVDPGLTPVPGRPNPADGTGFVDGVAFTRVLTVNASAPPGDFSLTVSMTFGGDQIGSVVAAPTDLELYVLAIAADSRAGMWVPAGTFIGYSQPTDIVGDSGVVVHHDGTVDYWAVRDADGVFAVGKGADADRNGDPPSYRPQPCGIAIIQPMLACMLGLLCLNKSRLRAAVLLFFASGAFCPCVEKTGQPTPPRRLAQTEGVNSDRNTC